MAQYVVVTNPPASHEMTLVTTKAFRIVMLDVPSPTILGESVELTCSYELDNEQLYSVKWYKNDVEFYRYVPNDWPPGQFLPLPGIRVDLQPLKNFSQMTQSFPKVLTAPQLHQLDESFESLLQPNFFHSLDLQLMLRLFGKSRKSDSSRFGFIRNKTRSYVSREPISLERDIVQLE
ncbi:uncharacterized protein CDAR_459461 [Caerostris darwini]|uniref:Ig-like domain-containing protein n=1 Tax=Caerostris darwini TaxID=1538125 RepID=A0AAV4UDI5_9ARAC|nr:uncharacterized protein CDAR_459461 [Caerostris darwini]